MVRHLFFLCGPIVVGRKKNLKISVAKAMNVKHSRARESSFLFFAQTFHCRKLCPRFYATGTHAWSGYWRHPWCIFLWRQGKVVQHFQWIIKLRKRDFSWTVDFNMYSIHSVSLTEYVRVRIHATIVIVPFIFLFFFVKSRLYDNFY